MLLGGICTSSLTSSLDGVREEEKGVTVCEKLSETEICLDPFTKAVASLRTDLACTMQKVIRKTLVTDFQRDAVLKLFSNQQLSNKIDKHIAMQA